MDRNFTLFGEKEITCNTCGYTMEYSRLLWDIGMEPPCPECLKYDLMEEGWRKFFSAFKNRTYNAAITLGWLPRRGGTSDELDIFILPDGPEAPPEEYYEELYEGLLWREEQAQDIEDEKHGGYVVRYQDEYGEDQEEAFGEHERKRAIYRAQEVEGEVWDRSDDGSLRLIYVQAGEIDK